MGQDIPSPEISILPNTVVSLPEVSFEIQRDFLSKNHEQVAMHFPSLCFAMSRVEVDSKEAPVLTISQHQRMEWYPVFKDSCNTRNTLCKW